MSLVAYDASSDEESDNDEPMNEATAITKSTNQQQITATTNGHISDDDDDFIQQPNTEQSMSATFSLALPKPMKENTIQDLLQDFPRSPFQALPAPKSLSVSEMLVEEDDEFLHKKDKFIPIETKPAPPPPPTRVPTKTTVKISIPSLNEFRDVQKDITGKGKTITAVTCKTNKSAGLLEILPHAKSERNFSKLEKVQEDSSGVTKDQLAAKTPVPAFIPDTVKYRRPAHSTEESVGTVTTKKMKPHNDKPQLVACSDSEASDDEDTKTLKDFFSFSSSDCLPEVSANEIRAMVAKKAAKMAEATSKYLADAEQNATAKYNEDTQSNIIELEMARKRFHDQQLDSEAVQALVGSSAKRRRNQNEPMNIMELNSAEILPNREDWMRTALASSTMYQPTGVLVDEEPAAGTKRKHQITYLAHKAKANEAELQAMWAANRQTRRATQSKYGF